MLQKRIFKYVHSVLKFQVFTRMFGSEFLANSSDVSNFQLLDRNYSSSNESKIF